jgi:hypothetical protein
MRDTIKMAQAKPVLGWGIGTFGQIFPMYQGSELYRKATVGGASVWEPRFYEFAHNDYLQFWAESGALGCILLASVPALLVVSICCHGSQGRRDAVSHWLAVGCVLVLLLALIDFPFGNEAVDVLFVTLFVLSGKFALLARNATAAERTNERTNQSEPTCTLHAPRSVSLHKKAPNFSGAFRQREHVSK